MSRQIVFIHGMWVNSWGWHDYKIFFEARGYTCHTPDLRYHNVDPRETPDPRLGGLSLLDYADDLEKFIRTLDERPMLMGHSMGGLLAQILASRGLAEKTVLLTPAAPSGIFALQWSVIKTFWKILLTPGFWEKPNKIGFKEAVYATMNLLPEEERKSAYEHIVHESGRVVFEMGLWPLDMKGAAKVDETRITCPILVIGAKQDRITPVSVVRRVAKKYRADYKEFEGHAHWVLGEPGWENIADFVSKWMDKKE